MSSPQEATENSPFNVEGPKPEQMLLIGLVIFVGTLVVGVVRGVRGVLNVFR